MKRHGIEVNKHGLIVFSNDAIALLEIAMADPLATHPRKLLPQPVRDARPSDRAPMLRGKPLSLSP
jgi:hypothetical protein